MPADVLTIEGLVRWVVFGAQWRVVDISNEQAVVDFCTCTGERVARLESDDPAVIGYLRTAQPEADLYRDQSPCAGRTLPVEAPRPTS